MRRFESRDVMIPVGVSESGELAWANGARADNCELPTKCGACTNTTAKPKPKPKGVDDLEELRLQLDAALA
jgi:hypothetical protein